MQTIAFAAPMLPGKTETDREAMASCTNGERKAEHEASRRRAGITRESVWIQSTPNGDLAVVGARIARHPDRDGDPGQLGGALRSLVSRRH